LSILLTILLGRVLCDFGIGEQDSLPGMCSKGTIEP
jgi:hypothetical protein